MFEEYDKQVRAKVTHERQVADAIELINQIITLENLKDKEHLQLLAEKKLYRQGESVVSFSLKALKELVEKL